MEKKYCPLKFTCSSVALKVDEVGWECNEEKCAWWDDLTGHCAILSISRHGAKGSFQVIQEERGK